MGRHGSTPRQGGPDFEALNDFLDVFIETLSLSKSELRFEHSDNVPEERIERWQEERDDVLDEFEKSLEDRRRTLLEGEETSGELEKVAEEYNETAADLLRKMNDGE